MEKQEKIMDRDKSIMKKICFVNYDMTVTGGVEQVTTTLANSVKNIRYTFTLFLEKMERFHMIWIRELRIEQN